MPINDDQTAFSITKLMLRYTSFLREGLRLPRMLLLLKDCLYVSV